MCIWLFGVIKNLQCATPKMEHFVIIVNGWKPLTIITKRSILDVAVALDPPLIIKENHTLHFSMTLLRPESINRNFYYKVIFPMG